MRGCRNIPHLFACSMAPSVFSGYFPAGRHATVGLMRFVIASMLAVALGGCASRMEAATPPTAGLASAAVHQALAEEGPAQFARVTPTLYRGGEPSGRDLELLRALGVTKVVDLRREGLGDRRAERAAARALGLEYVEYPFFGVFGARTDFLDALLSELGATDGGAIYVHCDDGKDRTSLAVALYRVVHEDWSPDDAWQREALEHGHRPTRLNREIELTFRDYSHEHVLRRQTAERSGPRRLSVERSLDGSKGAFVKAPSGVSRAGSAAP